MNARSSFQFPSLIFICESNSYHVTRNVIIVILTVCTIYCKMDLGKWILIFEISRFKIVFDFKYLRTLVLSISREYMKLKTNKNHGIRIFTRFKCYSKLKYVRLARIVCMKKQIDNNPAFSFAIDMKNKLRH